MVQVLMGVATALFGLVLHLVHLGGRSYGFIIRRGTKTKGGAQAGHVNLYQAVQYGTIQVQLRKSVGVSQPVSVNIPGDLSIGH